MAITKKYKCENCNSDFYGNPEKHDIDIDGHYLCSYCIGDSYKCQICGKIITTKRKTKNEVCTECFRKIGVVKNRWYILRYKTFLRDNFTCRYCGRSPLKDSDVVLNCDHIIPKCELGIDDLDNLVTSCYECNLGKFDVMLEKSDIENIKNRTELKL